MIKTFFHIIIALSVFLSSAGFWVSKHYCQEKFQKTTFIIGFGSCCSAKTADSCSADKMSCDEEEHEEDKGCCHSKSSFFKLEQDQQIQLAELTPLQLSILLNPIILGFSISLPAEVTILPHYNFGPPLIVYDRQVRLQTFLC